MNTMKLALTVLLFTQLAQASEFISEASGLCRVGATLIITGDEEKSALWISDLSGKMAKTKVQNGSWDDMEALAAVDSKHFYGVTSLGLSKKGERKEAREKIVLFSLLNGKLTQEKEIPLRTEILNFLAREGKTSIDLNRTMTAPPKEGGLNVEGAAYDSGKLFLGLRSPLTKTGKAIILEVDVKSGKVSAWKTVDLKGNGIRDLSLDQDKLLILAGSSDESDAGFAIYSLNSSDSVTQLNVPGFSDLLRPEGILKEKDGSLLFVQDFVKEENQRFMIRLKP